MNLSSDDSLSAASGHEEDVEGSEWNDDRSTMEMSDFKQLTRDPVPDGYLRRPVIYAQTNPRLTLVFLAYEKPATDVTKHSTLINVSHIAHKFGHQ